jgi:hypothetical protein
MAPTTATALVIILAFVLPGYVCVLFQERTFKSAAETTPLDRLLQALYYSVWCYLLLVAVALILGLDREWFVHLYDQHRSDPAQLVWRGAAALLGSATIIWFCTVVWHDSGANHWTLRHVRLNAHHQQPTAWDFFFRKRHWVHVKIKFADHTVYGYYGKDSFASYAKDGRDLYLEYIFAEDDDNELGFGEWDEENRGGWVNLADAIAVEFYSPQDETKSSREGAGPKARRTGGTEESSAEASTPTVTPAQGEVIDE